MLEWFLKNYTKPFPDFFLQDMFAGINPTNMSAGVLLALTTSKLNNST
jgi:hypothetical protein